MMQPSPARVLRPEERARLITSRSITCFSLSISIGVYCIDHARCRDSLVSFLLFKAVNDKPLRGVTRVVERVAGHQRDRRTRSRRQYAYVVRRYDFNLV